MEFKGRACDVITQTAWAAHPLLADLRAASTMFDGGPPSQHAQGALFRRSA